MTTVEYLLRPKMLRAEISRKLIRVESLRRYAARLTAPVREVEVQSTPDPARMQAFLSEAADEEKAIAALRKDLKQAITDTAIYLSFLPDTQMLRIMELRYLEFLDWEEIAREVGYFHTSLYRIHRRALDLLPPPPATPGEGMP